MADLSHWNVAETFSGQEAAALVLGLDPLDKQAELWKTQKVLDRMIEGHRLSKALVNRPLTAEQFNMERNLPSWSDALVSVLFDQFPLLQKEPWPGNPNRQFELPNRLAGADGAFEVQKFARDELHRWLSVVGIVSVYQFVKKPSFEEDKPRPRWPWGDHHTESLAHLEAAARKFWTGYDPQKAKETAPKNAEVVAWLMESRNVSNQQAKAIATMLRPDNLPTGPRK